MGHVVQRLIYPQGMKTLGESMIYLPDELRRELMKLFSFDIGKCAELEGGNIYRSLCNLHQGIQNQNVCVIKKWIEKGERGFALNSLAPVDKAVEVIELIEDQLSTNPKLILETATGMKRAIDNHDDGKSHEKHIDDKDTIGWIDMRTSAFILLDNITFYRNRFPI